MPAKMALMAFLSVGRNRDTDMRMGLQTQVKEAGYKRGASSTDMYTLSCVKQAASGKLPTAKGAQLSAL